MGSSGASLMSCSNCASGLVELVILLVVDAEIEPGVGQGRVAALNVLEESDGLGGSSAAEKREGVVQLLGDGVGGEVERLLELGDGFGVGGGIFVEGFAEIAVSLEGVFGRSGGAEGEEREDCGRGEDPEMLRIHQGEL